MKLSFKIVPCEDESVSSWLIRISRKHYLNCKEFCDFYDIAHLLKGSMDIKADISQLKNILGYNLNGIKTVNSLIKDFNWKNGRSEWLIYPNKKGSSLQNSYTQICASCLTEKAYIQLKWKFNIFYGCSICETKLINLCPSCNRHISPLKADFQIRNDDELNPLWNCSNCGFDYRTASQEKLTKEEIEEIKKLEKAYMEVPANIQYLEFKQFGTIKGLQ